MKVLHIGFGSHFTEDMVYQDNVLIELNVKEGHDVTFIADSYIYKGCDVVYVGEEDRILSNGVRLIRLDYDRIINRFVSDRIRKARKLLRMIKQIKPETIMFHGLLSYELMTVSEYAYKNHIALYTDCHADYTNTAGNCISKAAYKYIHGYFIKKSLPHIKKILYITKQTKDFLIDLYRIPECKLEFYPLGGVIQQVEKQEHEKEKLVSEFHLPKDAIICAHSGKMTKEKRTRELLKAFRHVPDDRLQMFVFGSIPDDDKEEFEMLVKADRRIHFLGWLVENEITDILCAADIYLQPGSQSSTSQMALCCGCAEAVAPTSSYKDIYGDSVIYVQSVSDLKKLFRRILVDHAYLEHYQNVGYDLARKKLDYKKLARRYLK